MVLVDRSTGKRTGTRQPAFVIVRKKVLSAVAPGGGGLAVYASCTGWHGLAI